MFPTVTIDDVRCQSMLNDLRDALIGAGQIGDAATVLEDEFRLFLKQVITLTPPHGLGQDAKAQGEQAVSRDLQKLFTPINDEMLNHIGSLYGVAGIDHWITGSKGDKLHLIWDKLDPTGQGIEQFHQSHRDNRGRVRGAKRARKDAWTAAYVVTMGDFKAYLTRVLSHVGRRKAGWALAYESVGGKVQRWISRHVGGSSSGSVINNLSDKNNPSITAFNSSPGIMGDERIVRDAFRVRREAMVKRLRLILSGYAKDVANGIRVSRKTHQTPGSDDATG